MGRWVTPLVGLALAGLAMSGCIVAPDPVPEEPRETPVPFNSAYRSERAVVLPAPRAWYIESEQDWEEQISSPLRRSKSSVDLGPSAAVVLAGQTWSTDARGIEVAALTLSGNILTVQYRVTTLGHACPVASKLSTPVEVVRVPHGLDVSRVEARLVAMAEIQCLRPGGLPMPGKSVGFQTLERKENSALATRFDDLAGVPIRTAQELEDVWRLWRFTGAVPETPRDVDFAKEFLLMVVDGRNNGPGTLEVYDVRFDGSAQAPIVLFGRQAGPIQPNFNPAEHTIVRIQYESSWNVAATALIEVPWPT